MSLNGRRQVNMLSMSLFTLVLATTPGAPALPDSVRPLLGQWACTARTYEGQDSGIDPCVWEFEAGGRLRRRLDGSDPVERRFTAAPEKAPALLDWMEGQDTIKAIYKVDGDTLTICYSHDRRSGRPTRFELPRGNKLIVLTFKRVKSRD